MVTGILATISAVLFVASDTQGGEVCTLAQYDMSGGSIIRDSYDKLTLRVSPSWKLPS